MAKFAAVFLVGMGILTSLAFQQKEKDWFGVLGLTFYDKAVSQAFGEYGDHTNYHERSDITLQMNWKEDGIAVAVDEPGRILSVFFFNAEYTAASTVFKRFEGKMPLGVTIDDSPDEVIEKIGTPNTDEGSAYRRIFYKTNYEYEFLFRQGVMQYMRIGVLGGKIKGKPSKLGN